MNGGYDENEIKDRINGWKKLLEAKKKVSLNIFIIIYILIYLIFN